MELCESAQKESKHSNDDEDYLDNDVSDHFRVVKGFPSILISFHVKLNSLDEIENSEHKNVVNVQVYVEQKQQEVLSVPEPYTVVDPGAVVVHV
jgi:hypothetical protein